MPIFILPPSPFIIILHPPPDPLPSLPSRPLGISAFVHDIISFHQSLDFLVCTLQATSAFDATALGVNTSADAFTAKYDCETGASGESICWEKEADFNSGDTAWYGSLHSCAALATAS